MTVSCPDFISRPEGETATFRLGDEYDPREAYKGMTDEAIKAMFARPLKTALEN